MPRHFIFVGLFAGWATAVALSAASPAPPRVQAAPPVSPAALSAASATPAASAEFAGDDTCAFCHEKQGKNLEHTLHGKALNVRTPAGTGRTCETCHGPGKAHAEAGGDITKITRISQLSPREASEACLSCHDRGNHVNWKGSMHDARSMSCITCHSVHNPASERAQLKAPTVIDQCGTCHKVQVAKLQRSGHMPLREGKMDCTSCHNPHGTTNVRMLKVGNWVNETCTSCHAEKRGPFLWDHAPVREACNTCHDPHGSNNDHMLAAKLPMLCQRCHIGTRHPSTIYDANQLANRSIRMIGRGCVNCHTQIHGSNSPAGHAFVR